MNPQKVPLLTFVCRVRMFRFFVVFYTKFSPYFELTNDLLRKGKEITLFKKRKKKTPQLYIQIIYTIGFPAMRFVNLGLGGKTAVLKICSKKGMGCNTTSCPIPLKQEYILSRNSDFH